MGAVIRPFLALGSQRFLIASKGNHYPGGVVDLQEFVMGRFEYPTVVYDELVRRCQGEALLAPVSWVKEENMACGPIYPAKDPRRIGDSIQHLAGAEIARRAVLPSHECRREFSVVREDPYRPVRAVDRVGAIPAIVGRVERRVDHVANGWSNGHSWRTRRARWSFFRMCGSLVIDVREWGRV